MEGLEITAFRHKPTHALSGGQKKQVSIADILVMEPELMILDEPTAALDPKHTDIVSGIVDDLTTKGITVLMATHDVDYAFSWADEVLLFHQGRLLKQGSPLEIFSDLEALTQTNLKQPMVLQVFNRLQKSGFLPQGLPTPTSIHTLMEAIQKG